MLEQPSFGRRLKQLRSERGLSQAALAGDGMSTGYLSRLESGARQPTARAVEHLTAQLGVKASAFEEPGVTDSLAQALANATSTNSDETVEALERALSVGAGQDPLLRWQALWLVAQWRRRHNEHAKEREFLEELVRLGDELGLPALRSRGFTQLARCLRACGEITLAVDAATTAHQLARDNELPVQDMAASLLALVSAEAEAGRLSEARAHADELTALTDNRSDSLWAEARWTAAAVRVRQGDLVAAQELLEQALDGFTSSENLALWTRLRVAAARLHLQKTPPELDIAEQYVEQAETSLAFVGIPALDQEVISLKADIAFQGSRFADARALLDRVRGADPHMTYRNRVRLDVLDSRLLIIEGEEHEGLRRMRALAEEAQAASNIDLAADIWRLLAETLTDARGASPA
ncbi:helix-turn-helix domain-containing protein [Streptomyces sp. ISL-98]|uniref:helix-turn-helix domain-containing protein n=1 Tax=Streptomyces sp. ISL-98 TaxID=2819192 RepID=UPI001BE859C9|nr:helix-turn-helix domain-containing protein [Streptomyces sp. ISL-98]MBT2508569.1 helix-turn-helix domain-containing protein [Streptomyces sp. ISL-98]